MNELIMELSLKHPLNQVPEYRGLTSVITGGWACKHAFA